VDDDQSTFTAPGTWPPRAARTARSAYPFGPRLLRRKGHGDHDAHVVKPSKTAVVELELTPGSYEAICTVPGHKEAGMSVTVEVGNRLVAGRTPDPVVEVRRHSYPSYTGLCARADSSTGWSNRPG